MEISIYWIYVRLPKYSSLNQLAALRQGEQTFSIKFTRTFRNTIHLPVAHPPFGLSDHLTVIMLPAIKKKLHKSRCRIIKVRDKRPSNIRSLGRYLLEIPWDYLSCIPSIDEKLSLMTSFINYGLNLVMPERTSTIHPNERPWINNNLTSLIKRRQKAFASRNVTLFKLLRNKVNRERKRCRKTYYQTKVHKLRDTKPSDWWREVKQLCGMSKSNKKGPRDSLHQDLDQDTDESLSNKINNIFINVMRNYTPLSEDIAVSVNDEDVPVFVSESTVAKKLREISTSRSSGLDDIPTWVLKIPRFKIEKSLKSGSWLTFFHYLKFQLSMT